MSHFSAISRTDIRLPPSSNSIISLQETLGLPDLWSSAVDVQHSLNNLYHSYTTVRDTEWFLKHCSYFFRWYINTLKALNNNSLFSLISRFMVSKSSVPFKRCYYVISISKHSKNDVRWLLNVMLTFPENFVILIRRYIT
jgi:hypothetical protein